MVAPIEGTTATELRMGQPMPFANVAAQEGRPRFSPDGKWLSYESNESGTTEVYVRPFPGPGGRSQVSTTGGNFHEWVQDRPELLYRTPDRVLMSVPYTTNGGVFQAGKPRVWGAKPLVVTERGYAPHSDGNRLAIAPSEDTFAPINTVTIVTNFFDELRRRVPNQR
jgi:serine/threonine-protein kinase